MRSSLILISTWPLTHACAGGYRGVPPTGHPGVAGDLDDGDSLYPCKGTSVCRKALRGYRGVFAPEGPWLPGDDYSMRLLESVANLSTTLKTDLCYWSQQTLPAPPDTLGQHHINEYDAPRVMNIYGELATSRMQKLMSSVSAIQFVGCSYGSDLRQAQCKFNQNTSVSCSAAASQQKIKWPVSSVMLRINPNTIQEIADMMVTWRTTESGHWPNMHAGGHKTGGAFQWGYKGGLFGKIVPCKDIPDGIINASHACDEVDPTTGRLYADEWWEIWSNLCNIFEDPLIPSTLEACKSEDVSVV